MDGALVGRDAELDRLIDAVAQALDGRGCLVLVTGAAGAGKTSLVAALALRASPRAEVVWGSAFEGGGAPVLWPWIQVLRRLSVPAALLARVEGEATADGKAAGSRFALFDDVAQVVVDHDRSCLVVILDDLHWADRSSVELLQVVGQRLRDRRVLVIATARADELDAAASAAFGRDAIAVRLGGLDRTDVGSLLQSAGLDTSGMDLDEVMRRTGGNPFFVLQVGQLAQVSNASAPVPSEVRDVLERQLARLPQGVVATLEIAAVCGISSDVDSIVAIGVADPENVLDHLDRACVAGVLDVDELGGRHFVHDLFRQTLVEGLPSGRREWLHRAVGHHLADRAASGDDIAVSEVAEHLLRARMADGGAEAAHWAAAAGDRATAQHAHGEAMTWYRRGREALHEERPLAASSPVDERCCMELRLREGAAARRAGRAEVARATLDQAVVLARDLGDPTLFARATIELALLGGLTSGGHSGVRAHLEEALERLPGDALTLRADLLAALAKDHYHIGGDTVDPSPLADEAMRVAEEAGDPATIVSCLAAKHDVSWRVGSATDRLPIADQLITAAEQSGDLGQACEGALCRYAALLELGDVRADGAFQDCARRARLSHLPRSGYFVTSRRATQALLQGRFDEADTLIGDAAKLARRLDETDGPVVEMNQRWELVSELGRRSELVHRLNLFARYTTHPAIIGSLALARLANGDRAGAEAALAPHVEVDFSTLRPAYEHPHAAAVLAEAFLAIGSLDAARRAAVVLRPASGFAVIVGAAVAFHGAVDHHLGL
ncbi:MAG: AAA family ATPase, partial [Actinomycetota bacterium]|nr:AAA family ATPase [Actinomycetota bacterium]